MSICKCKMCGYQYICDNGDPKGQIAPGTSFEDLPDDWRCPICKAKKTNFRIVEND
ncbi:rubredoxin [bacterium]|nr:rubredoxin [bacterium]